MSFQPPQGSLSQLEQTVVDLVRAGVTANSAGVRQLARGLVRKTPPDVTDPESFRGAVGAALLEKSPFPTGLLRGADASSLPADEDTGSALMELGPDPNAPEPVLPLTASKRIAEILEEWNQRSSLEEAGLQPTRTLLLSGPPGVGKTMTVSSMALRLDLPLLSIDLASVMSSFLGRTGRNLRSALDYGREHPCVVFLDEFDALAKRRDDDADVGELKRLVNVLLLELERWPAHSLLVAATNHPQLLDRAVERRFDAVIEIGYPDTPGRTEIVRRLTDRFSPDPRTVSLVAECTEGFSASDLTSLVVQATRRAVVTKGELNSELVRSLVDVTSPSGAARDRLCFAASDRLGMSNRAIAELVGVSHPTVSRAIERAQGHG